MLISLIFSFQLVAFAADTINWSETGVFKIDALDSDVNETITGDRLSEGKITSNPYVAVKTIAKNMDSCPKFRLVDKNKLVRSNYLTVSDTVGEWVRDLESNTGAKGEMMYAQMKAAWNQITNNKTISIKFRPY